MQKLLNYFRLVHMFNNANIHLAMLEITNKMMDFAVQVQQYGKPMLTSIATIDMSETGNPEHHDIVNVWAACGDANPIDRIKSLKAQNTMLKKLLSTCQDDVKDEDLKLNIKIVLDSFE